MRIILYYHYYFQVPNHSVEECRKWCFYIATNSDVDIDGLWSEGSVNGSGGGSGGGGAAAGGGGAGSGDNVVLREGWLQLKRGAAGRGLRRHCVLYPGKFIISIMKGGKKF